MQTLNLNNFPQNKIAIIIGLDYVKNKDKISRLKLSEAFDL